MQSTNTALNQTLHTEKMQRESRVKVPSHSPGWETKAESWTGSQSRPPGGLWPVHGAIHSSLACASDDHQCSGKCKVLTHHTHTLPGPAREKRRGRECDEDQSLQWLERPRPAKGLRYTVFASQKGTSCGQSPSRSPMEKARREVALTGDLLQGLSPQ